ncbi:MAG: MFS transporter [Tannerella sp.]|nr:MFS transporter [Tannerella sp.]
MKNLTFIKLGIMMFMQYLLLAVWWVPFAAHLNVLPYIEPYQIGLLLSAMAFGSMAAPLVGVIADRYISSEKLLAVLNLLVAVFLFLATIQTGFTGLMITVTLAMLCYMPSWGITSSIAMTHASSEQFPRIRLMGSIGWIASALFSIVAIHVFNSKDFDTTRLPMYCAIFVAVFSAFFNLFLPKTPPTADKSSKTSIADIFGLKVISSLKNKYFNRFILLTILTVIPFALLYSFGSAFLQDEQFKYITATMNIRQIAELFFLFITTSILLKFGFKNALTFGLIALLFQYIALYLGVELGQQALYYVGLLPHGLIFGLFFVAGQVYTDKVVPHEFKAQAQGFLAFITWGVGILLGNMICGWLMNNFKVDNHADWGLLFACASAATLVIIVLFMLLFKNPAPAKANEK